MLHLSNKIIDTPSTLTPLKNSNYTTVLIGIINYYNHTVFSVYIIIYCLQSYVIRFRLNTHITTVAFRFMIIFEVLQCIISCRKYE